MVISFHKQPIVNPPISLGGVEIERVNSVELLGIGLGMALPGLGMALQPKSAPKLPSKYTI